DSAVPRTAAFTHAFVWDSTIDAASQSYQGQVLFRITPSDAFATGPAVVTAFAVDNNFPPQVSSIAVTTPGRAVGGTVALSYVLFDTESDTVTSLIVTAERENGALLG